VSVFKSYGAVLLGLLLVACGAPKPRQSAPHAAPAPAIPPAIAGRTYRIDPAQSELRLLVYRAGPMASLGHNHVIVNHALGGRVEYAGKSTAASFFLTVPAAAFVVDEAAARREEGADFAEEVPEEAKSATSRNMQGAALLDAEQFPEITIRSIAVTGADRELEATLALSVAGHESTLVVPFTVDYSAGRLRASGALTIRQSAIGLTPFSVFLGALRVQDEMRVKFKLVALLT
jgi:polyisoprenoid-binding protein YceI